MHSPTALTAFLRDALDGDVADGMVVSAGSGMNVTVGAGTARVGRDPSYDINITGTETVNVGAASPSNPMNSLIVAYVDRSVAGSTSVTDNTNDVFKLKAVDGVAATSPADPSTSTIQAAIGATNPYIVLARVRKRAGSTSILSTDITDLRNMVTLKAGRISAPNLIANNLINSDHLANGIVLPRHIQNASIPTTKVNFEATHNIANTGDAGGTMTTFVLGGLKIATGTTTGIVGLGDYSKRVTFPTGFFSVKPHFIANISRAYGSVSNNYVIGNNLTKDYADIYWSNKTSSSSVGGEVGWMAIGR